MPKLPVHESGVKPVKSVAISNQPAQVPMRGLEDAYKGTETILQGAADVITKWQNAQDTMDYTQYKANTATFMAGQEAAAAVDPNPENIAVYQAAINDYKKTALEGFHNKGLAQRVGIELEKDINITNLKIGNIFRKKQLYQNKIDLGKSIEALAAKKRTAISPTLKVEAQQEIENLLAVNVANGTITGAEASNLRGLQVKADILSDGSVREKDSQVLADLKAGKDGPYAYLSEADRLKAVKDMQARVFQNNQAYKRDVELLQTDTAVNAAQSLVDRKLTSMDIEAGLKLGVMDADTARVLTAAIEAKKTIPTKTLPVVADKYLSLLNKNLDDSVTAKQIIINATKEWQAGTIKDDEYSYFIQQAQKKLEIERGGQTGWDKATQMFKNAVSLITSAMPAVAAAKVVRQLIESKKTEDPVVVADELVRQQRREKYPWINNLPKEGEIRLFPDGVKRRIFPDGRIEDVK